MVKFEELFKINFNWRSNTTITITTRGEMYFQITAKTCVLLNPDVALFDGNLIIVDCDEYIRCYNLLERMDNNANNDFYQ